MPFDSPDYDLAELLKDSGGGKIQLPDFQREWKWEDDRIRGLLASISLGYPIGVIMLLQIGGDGVRFAPKPLAGVRLTDSRRPELLLLDGQQRMTSLYQALSSGEPVETTDARGKRLRRWYYLDMAEALDPNGDPEEAIVSVPEDRVVRGDFGRVVELDVSTMDNECRAEMFPLGRLFDPSAMFAWHGNYVAQAPERAERWNVFYSQVLANFMSYKLPAIILNKETPKDAVCTVFEKVNTGGVPLNVFELLTATFASENFRLKDDWQKRKSALQKWPTLASLENTDFLQAVTLLATRARRQAFVPSAGESVAPGISCKRRDVLRLTLSDYQEWADAVTEALGWAATFLAQERIFSAKDIPYRTQLVPLSAIRVALGAEADNHAAAAKLRQWYWCGVLGELYGGTTETRFARDLEQVVPWVREDGPVPNTIAEATFRAGRLRTLRTRNSAAYKGIYALLMRNGCMDWIKRQPLDMASFFDYQIDIHHVFPKAWCEKNGIDHAQRESIVNKTALSYATNRSIGGRSPADYVPLIERQAGISADELDTIMATHELIPGHLRTADFDAFFTGRSEALLALIEEAMGKSPVRDDVTLEGDEAAFEDEPDDAEEPLEPEAVEELYATPI